MKTVCFALGMLLALVIGAGAAAAQQPPYGNLPPTIVSFSSSLESISVDEAEAGSKTATLSWATVGVTGDYHLMLDTYADRGWNPLGDFANQPLPTSSLFVAVVRHTCGFCAPTYRLSILDSRNRIVDQRVLSIPFAAEASAAPQIETFSTGVQGIDANSLAQHTARVPLFWEISHRSATSNLLFEQVFDNGGSASIELPRAELWVASSAQGEVAPILPPASTAVQLRLRLVDVKDGTVFDEKMLSIPILGVATVPVVPTNNPPPTAISGVTYYDSGGSDTPDAPAQILLFNVSSGPVDRGATVTVNWNVIHARSLLVVRLTPDNQFADFVPNPPMSGSWTVTLPEYYNDRAEFYLLAIDNKDQQVASTTAVNINCPFTYFFGADRAAQSCPKSGVVQVDGSYQAFERGIMFWRGDTRQIYVLFNDGNRVAVYADSYSEGEPITIADQPPAGLYAPTRGFGKLWSLTPEIAGALGWASGPELPFVLRTQDSGAYRQPRSYFALPDGRTVYTVENQWGFVAP